jgi:Pre-PUA-like domain
MFKKPLPTLIKSQVKSSIQRNIKAKVIQKLAHADVVDEVIPKKEKYSSLTKTIHFKGRCPESGAC